jgi:hypothetical protein
MFNLYSVPKILICSPETEVNLQFSWDKFGVKQSYLIRRPEQGFFYRRSVITFVQSLLEDCLANSKNISIVTESKELIGEILNLEFYKRYFVLVTDYTPVWFGHIDSITNFNIERKYF